MAVRTFAPACTRAISGFNDLLPDNPPNDANAVTLVNSSGGELGPAPAVGLPDQLDGVIPEASLDPMVRGLPSSPVDQSASATVTITHQRPNHLARTSLRPDHFTGGRSRPQHVLGDMHEVNVCIEKDA